MSAETEQKEKKDLFAEIAALRRIEREKMLVEPQPPELPERFLPTGKTNPAAVFRPRPKLDTSDKLQRELERQRRAHAKFLRNLAPKPEPTRVKVSLERFDWRVQTEADLRDFSRTLNGEGSWEKVRIPHYGGPLGRATTYYRKVFHLTRSMLDKGAVFVCFKGVDYQAHVFVNGVYLGSHEGFFAPFEFDFTPVARLGKNTLLVRVENDAICMSNDSWGEDGYKYEGDKLYAATGPGYDDPEVGWHHCPPGMGIYQDVFIEARAPVHVHDIFVRPLPEEKRAEAWIEVYSCHSLRQEISLELSVFGQNFRRTVFRARKYELPGPVGPGVNYFRLPFGLPNPRLWDPETPWLYQIQVRISSKRGKTLDVATSQFGMRSFRMDEEQEPKGRFYLNGWQIRLRGANTMGHLQQCVIKKDWAQLRDDILLAKICHINFLRLTQRPVQPEIYDFCDRLGLMTQTDLPLFGVLRRNQFCEALRQAGEMERLVRKHPCNILISYINEPFPNAGGKTHRHLTRPELESFFEAADQVVHLVNPDRVIKAVDGDYDPPGPGLPDNHCYCGWYNGHGLDIGKLHKGYWQKVKPGWFYGCGEFGSEGLDSVEVMRKYYPKDWLPKTAEEEKNWSPKRIIKAQTGDFHYLWFETQRSLADWVAASQAHQAWVTRLMTEAFRRDSRMSSCAIHLFIDAFPSGWMKAIMDVDRQPKPAYFAYREALTPLMANLRTDRYAFFSGEEMCLEAWVCNDLTTVPKNIFLHYQLEIDKKVILAQRARAVIPSCGSAFQGFLRFRAPTVKRRSQVAVRLGLIDGTGKVLHETAVYLDIFPLPGKAHRKRAVIFGSEQGKAAKLAKDTGLRAVFSATIKPGDVLLIDDFARFTGNRKEIIQAVRQGATAVFVELAEGEYEITGDRVTIVPCARGARHFVSRGTGHPLVADFAPDDFKFWYDPEKGYVTPLLATTFTAPGWDAVLTTGNKHQSGNWQPTLAVAEKRYGDGYFRISQIALAGRTPGHPVALLFARRLLGIASQ